MSKLSKITHKLPVQLNMLLLFFFFSFSTGLHLSSVNESFITAAGDKEGIQVTSLKMYPLPFRNLFFLACCHVASLADLDTNLAMIRQGRNHTFLCSPAFSRSRRCAMYICATTSCPLSSGVIALQISLNVVLTFSVWLSATPNRCRHRHYTSLACSVSIQLQPHFSIFSWWLGTYLEYSGKIHSPLQIVLYMQKSEFDFYQYLLGGQG